MDVDTCATTIRLVNDEGEEVVKEEDSLSITKEFPLTTSNKVPSFSYDHLFQLQRQRITFLKSDLENFHQLVDSYRARPMEEQTQTLALLLNNQANAHLSNLVELTGAVLLEKADLVQLQVEKQFLTTLLFEIAPKVENVYAGENHRSEAGHRDGHHRGFHPFHRFHWWDHFHRGGHFQHKMFKKLNKEKFEKLEKKLAKKEKKLMEKCAKKLRKMKVK